MQNASINNLNTHFCNYWGISIFDLKCHLPNGTLDRVFYPPQAIAKEGNEKQVTNTIMSTTFALKFWTNQIIDIDIILSFISIHS